MNFLQKYLPYIYSEKNTLIVTHNSENLMNPLPIMLKYYNNNFVESLYEKNNSNSNYICKLIEIIILHVLN